MYGKLAHVLSGIPNLVVPPRDPRESYVASSIQFTLSLETPAILTFLAACDSRGLHIKWFGRDEPQGFTSNYTHWHYMREAQALPRSLKLMQGLCDMRIALSMTDADCETIGQIVRVAMTESSK